ncbi:hypothetical protein IFR05_013106 [Cadophora sp. M221]|nr:hypothetical protein IFR05_013106 [Cadophora sp. M221]
MGSASCWEAVGAARETFVRIADEIRLYLDKHSDEVAHQVTWTMYMIGKTRESAEPMIMFCCRDTDCRKRVRKTVEQSGILEKYPGVRVGDAVRPPDFDQLVQLAGTSSHGDSNLFPSLSGGNRKRQRSMLASDGDLDTEETSDVTIYGREDRLGVGCPIVIVTKHHSGTSSPTYMRATAGGILVAGNRYFYLTTGHSFDKPADTIPKIEDDNDEDDYEFDIGEESDSEGDSGFVETTSRGSLSPDLVDYNGSDESSPAFEPSGSLPSTACIEEQREITPSLNRIGSMDLKEDSMEASSRRPGMKEAGFGLEPLPSLDDHIVVGDLLEPTVYQPHLDLDYALVELRPGLHNLNEVARNVGQYGFTIYPRRIVMGRPQETKVLAVTGSAGVLEGTLSGTPTYRNQPGSTKFREMWTVRLVGQLNKGDCGSWVVDSVTGDLLGHIIAGSPKSGVAYILPAQQIFDDAPNRYGLQLQLSTTWRAGEASTSYGDRPTLGFNNTFETTGSLAAFPGQELSSGSKGKEREFSETISTEITVAGQLRRWKCPVENCKSHEYGWSTQEELEKHHNEKHPCAATAYSCKFKPCLYSSKRESNCKHHMEKAHPWEYVRPTTSERRGKPLGIRKAQHQSRKANLMTPPDDMNTNSDAKSDSGYKSLFSILGVPSILMTSPDVPFGFGYERSEYPPKHANGHDVLIRGHDTGRMANARSEFSDDSGISGMSSSSHALFQNPMNLVPDPYASYQDGQLVAIGVYREGRYFCQHLEGICHEHYYTSEELQYHFEQRHFAFTRISPAERHICSQCVGLNETVFGLKVTECKQCYSRGTIQLWIYGMFIWTSSGQKPTVNDFNAPPSFNSTLPSFDEGFEDGIADIDSFNALLVGINDSVPQIHPSINFFANPPIQSHGLPNISNEIFSNDCSEVTDLGEPSNARSSVIQFDSEMGQGIPKDSQPGWQTGGGISPVEETSLTKTTTPLGSESGSPLGFSESSSVMSLSMDYDGPSFDFQA